MTTTDFKISVQLRRSSLIYLITSYFLFYLSIGILYCKRLIHKLLIINLNKLFVYIHFQNLIINDLIFYDFVFLLFVFIWVILYLFIGLVYKGFSFTYLRVVFTSLRVVVISSLFTFNFVTMQLNGVGLTVIIFKFFVIYKRVYTIFQLRKFNEYSYI